MSSSENDPSLNSRLLAASSTPPSFTRRPSSRLRSRRLLTAAVAGVVTVPLAVGLAAAATGTVNGVGDRLSGLIQACADTQSGALRLVTNADAKAETNTGDRCSSNERPVYWLTSPDGGSSGVTATTTSTTVKPDTTTTTRPAPSQGLADTIVVTSTTDTATCPVGRIAVGGGGTARRNFTFSGAATPFLTSSAPTAELRGWQVQAESGGVESSYAVCALGSFTTTAILDQRIVDGGGSRLTVATVPGVGVRAVADGIDCGADCSEVYSTPTRRVTLTAVLDPDMEFFGWSVPTCAPRSTTCTVDVAGLTSVVVRARPLATVTVTRDGNSLPFAIRVEHVGASPYRIALDPEPPSTVAALPRTCRIDESNRTCSFRVPNNITLRFIFENIGDGRVRSLSVSRETNCMLTDSINETGSAFLWNASVGESAEDVLTRTLGNYCSRPFSFDDKKNIISMFVTVRPFLAPCGSKNVCWR